MRRKLVITTYPIPKVIPTKPIPNRCLPTMGLNASAKRSPTLLGGLIIAAVGESDSNTSPLFELPCSDMLSEDAGNNVSFLLVTAGYNWFCHVSPPALLLRSQPKLFDQQGRSTTIAAALFHRPRALVITGSEVPLQEPVTAGGPTRRGTGRLHPVTRHTGRSLAGPGAHPRQTGAPRHPTAPRGSRGRTGGRSDALGGEAGHGRQLGPPRAPRPRGASPPPPLGGAGTGGTGRCSGPALPQLRGRALRQPRSAYVRVRRIGVFY